jgi:hypothetical protein
MSVMRSVPSQLDPSGIDDLIADARLIALPRQDAVDPARAERSETVVISPASLTLVEGYDDYGA